MKEKAVLVEFFSIITPDEKSGELSQLTVTAGAEVVSQVFAKTTKRINPGYYIGRGKAEEIRKLISDTNLTS